MVRDSQGPYWFSLHDPARMSMKPAHIICSKSQDGSGFLKMTNSSAWQDTFFTSLSEGLPTRVSTYRNMCLIKYTVNFISAEAPLDFAALLPCSKVPVHC